MILAWLKNFRSKYRHTSATEIGVSSNLVFLTEGSVAVDSTFGAGSTFHVCLPESVQISLPEETEVEPVTEGNERILLADDEELMAEVGKAMLETLGYHVVAKKGSLEAL